MDSVTIKNRTFKFKIPNPWDGCAIFNMITTYDIPFGADIVVGIKSARRIMPQDELQTYLKLCLKYCYEQVNDKDIQVVDDDGGIGIIDATAPLFSGISTQFILFFIHWLQGEIS